MNCWEYKKCGRDENSANPCPAYPNRGEDCWMVAGTFCDGEVRGTEARKYSTCMQCDWYQKMQLKTTIGATMRMAMTAKVKREKGGVVQ